MRYGVRYACVAKLHKSRGLIRELLLCTFDFPDKRRKVCTSARRLRKLQEGMVWINSRGSSERRFAPGHRLGHPHVCLTTDIFHRLSGEEKLNLLDQ